MNTIYYLFMADMKDSRHGFLQDDRSKRGSAFVRVPRKQKSRGVFCPILRN